MLKQKIYENILWAKDEMSRLDDIPNDSYPGGSFSWTSAVAAGERLPGEIFILWPQLDWGQKMALLTVLVTGSFSEDTGNFLMPATKFCMLNYKKVEHDFKHGRRLTVFFYGWTCSLDGETHHHPDYLVDLRTGRVEILANPEYREEW